MYGNGADFEHNTTPNEGQLWRYTDMTKTNIANVTHHPGQGPLHDSAHASNPCMTWSSDGVEANGNEDV